MNAKIKNALEAAGKYMDDQEANMFWHSLFAGGTVMFTIYRLRNMYKTGKAYYQQAAAKNALEQSKKATDTWAYKKAEQQQKELNDWVREQNFAGKAVYQLADGSYIAVSKEQVS